jgi:hypothetical protein
VIRHLLPRSTYGVGAGRPRHAAVRRGLRSAAVTRLVDAAEGVPVHVAGVVAPGPTTPSPVSGRPCVYWQLSLHAGWSWWFASARAEAGVVFRVDDGTAHALVEPRLAQVALAVDRLGHSGRDLSETELRALFVRCGRTETLPGRIWFREAVLVPGDRVHVLGAGVREPDEERVAAADGLRGGAPTRLRVRGAAGVPFLIGDDPRLDR